MKTWLLALPLVLAQESADWRTELVEEGERMKSVLVTRAARALLDGVPRLPEVEPRVYWLASGGGYLSEACTAEAREQLDEEARAALTRVEVDTRLHYRTFYGSPLASLRSFDVAAEHAQLDAFAGLRVLDFGFGSIAQLRLLELAGANAVGTEVMPQLREMYRGHESLPDAPGSLRLVFDRWPATASSRAAAGSGFDLIVSKNTLKRGYVFPPEEVDPRLSIDLGLPADDWMRRAFEALRPGGHLVIYNLGGRPDPERYSPQTDIACPWTPEELEGFGFEVVAHDVDDSATAREVGYALRWDEGGMDLEGGLFALTSVLRRRADGE